MHSVMQNEKPVVYTAVGKGMPSSGKNITAGGIKETGWFIQQAALISATGA